MPRRHIDVIAMATVNTLRNDGRPHPLAAAMILHGIQDELPLWRTHLIGLLSQ